MYCLCVNVLYYYHRVSTQLQLTNISYHRFLRTNSNFSIQIINLLVLVAEAECSVCGTNRIVNLIHIMREFWLVLLFTGLISFTYSFVFFFFRHGILSIFYLKPLTKVYEAI
jgi:hypothetical protein